MTRNILIASILATLPMTANTAFAGNAGASLGDCYNHVISACNQNSNHPVPCAESGMNACDELFEARMQDSAKIRLILVGDEPPRFAYSLIPTRPRPTDNHGRGNGGGSSSSTPGKP